MSNWRNSKRASFSKVVDIRQSPSDEVVDRDDGISVAEQGITEVRPYKPGAAGYACSLLRHCLSRNSLKLVPGWRDS